MGFIQRSSRRESFSCVMAVAIAFVAASAAIAQIRQAGFEAFRRGTPGNAGANLYVSRSGKVQVINHWDLNRDGYNDILISNDHDNDEVVDAMVYWNSTKGFAPLLPDLWREQPLARTLFGLLDGGGKGITRLPAFGGGKSLIADLNGDGYPDLVFCNYIHNYPGVRSAYVYWGGARGYDPKARTELPTNWAAGVAAADLNGDGFLELVFANQGSESGAENISADTGLDSYIYWGSARGYDPKAPQLLLTDGARDVAIADLNGDGHPDLAFLNGERQAKNVQVFWGAAGGRYSKDRTQVAAVPDPITIRAGDLNRDGIADIVITTSAAAQSIAMDIAHKDPGAVVVLFGSKKG
ncbi:MAG: VCBS repeat-containing protein [Bryobacteraceae bacterium]